MQRFPLCLIVCYVGFAFSAFAGNEKNISPRSPTSHDIHRIAQEKGVRNVDQLIPALPDDLLSSYVLIYRSMSSQQGSFENPRVIISSQDGHFMAGFNGSVDQRGYETLEMMDFDPTTASFTFSSLTFKDGVSILSEPNPKTCLACHAGSQSDRSDPRPDWEPWPTWPGVYGSIAPGWDHLDDLVRDGAVKEEEAQQLHQAQTEELPRLQEFVRTHATHPRYKHLPNLDQYDAGKIPGHFSQLMSGLNGQRIVRKLISQPWYPRFKYAIYGVVQCGGVFMPDSVRKRHEAFPARKEYGSLKMGDLFIPDALNLIVEPLGMSTESWSMDFVSKGRFSFAHRYASPGGDIIRSALRDGDSELGSLGCDEIARKSIEALDEP